jgi:hypothetical protein
MGQGTGSRGGRASDTRGPDGLRGGDAADLERYLEAQRQRVTEAGP